MAHEISNVTGRDEMSYVGMLPWHGLGEEFPAGTTIRQGTNCLDWPVATAPLHGIAPCRSRRDAPS